MSHDDVLFGYRLRLFTLADELQNVSRACALMGVHRSTYYRWKRQVDRWGLEALKVRERRRPRMPNEIGPHLEQRIVAFSLAPDITSLVQKKLVSPSWKKDRWKGIVTQSVVVFVVRDGNPKKLRTWDDLLRPGVQVITPNPFTSGGARWNIMAAYGSQIAQGKTPAQAQAFLAALLKNVVVQDKSARDSLQTFSSGKGDVLISYENEAITAQQKGVKLDYVVPAQTILIENPIAVTKNASKPSQAFVTYLYTPAAQTIFAKKGYRPVVSGISGGPKFPKPSGLFTIKTFGGWSVVTKKFFDPQSGKSVLAR